MELPKSYDPKEEEIRWQKFWEEEQVYKFRENSKKEIFSIDTPPPTFSGEMHLGHSFSYSQGDFIVRYHRMTGKNVFYPFGTDDNGLPTQLLVQKLKNVSAIKMGRESFRQLCIETLKEKRPDFVKDWKNLGISCDFGAFYTTIGDHTQKISQESFIDLYRDGREYRAEAPAMFCPKCRTAISQVECEDHELPSFFNDIVFKVGDEELIIATTRPELLPACVAVFYHPNDKRYTKYAGKKAKVPLFDIEVPILPDERADPEKGTGIVMCCTFGDQTDMEWQKAHSLPIIMAIGRDGNMTAESGKYEGLQIEEARKQIVLDLQEAGLLKHQKPITHAVNVHERCGTPIEFVHSKQWFIKYLDLKDDMLKWGAELKWYPEHMKYRYINWVNGLQWDWCISRQIFFGVPFPVWYCKKCEEVMVARKEDLPVDPTVDKPPYPCAKCKSTEFNPETDIINTWATSSLTPQIASALFPKSYDNIYPMTLRIQAHDIITFWLFNTVVKSRLHNKVNPWRDVVISGHAQDPHGKKMSKSKGNVIAPQKMMEKYSADALRYWAAGSKLGDDLPFQEKDLVTGQKTVTKLWNVSKFAIMHLEDYSTEQVNLTLLDKWVLSKLQKVIQSATDNFDKYEYAATRLDTSNFFWQVLCDNYLEIVKDRLYNPDRRGQDQRRAAQFALYQSVLTCLKLFAPIMPHITESVYQLYFRSHEEMKSIHISSWPKYNFELVNEEAEKKGDVVVAIVSSLRKYKSMNKMSLKASIVNLTVSCSDEDREAIKEGMDDLRAVCHIQNLVFGETEQLECEGTSIKLGIEMEE